MLGKGPVTPRVPEKGALGRNSRGPRTSHGVPDPHRLSGPSAGREQTPWGRSGAATCPQAQARARPRSFPGKTHPPTAFNTGDLSALCHSRARGDFCQAVLLIARCQGAQCSRWRHPRHARQSVTPVRHDSSATEYHNAYTVDPTLYAATYTASTGASPMGQVKTPPRSESLQGDEAYPERDSQSTVNVFFMVNYTSLLGPLVGIQRLCMRPPCAIKGGRPLEKDSSLKKGLGGRG